MFFLEAFNVTEPADAVPDGPDRKLNHHFFIFAVIIVGKNRLVFAFFMNDKTEFYVKLFDTGDVCPRYSVVAEQNDPGVDIGESDTIGFVIVRKQNPDAVIEVELNPLNRIQSRNLRHFSVNRLLVHLLPLSQFLTCGQIRLGGIDADILRRRIVIRRYGKIIHLKTPD